MTQTKKAIAVTEEIAINSKNEESLSEVKTDEKSSKRKSGLRREIEIELDLKNHFFPRT